MKLLSIIFVSFIIGCSKDSPKPVYPKGTLVKLHNIKIPEASQPFTIDSVFLITEKYNSYYVHDMNHKLYYNLADYQFQVYKP